MTSRLLAGQTSSHVPESLLQAVARGGGIPDLLHFLKRGGDPNTLFSTRRWTLLHLAAEHQNIAFAIALLDAGAEVNPSDWEGWTPLMQSVDACVDAHLQDNSPLDWTFTVMLIERGADSALRTEQGRDVFDWVRSYGTDLEQHLRTLVRTHAPLRGGEKTPP